MRRFVAIAGVAVITSLLPPSVARGDVPDPVASKTPDGNSDADVLRILDSRGRPVSGSPGGYRPVPPTKTPSPTATPSPTKTPSPTSTTSPTSAPSTSSPSPSAPTTNTPTCPPTPSEHPSPTWTEPDHSTHGDHHGGSQSHDSHNDHHDNDHHNSDNPHGDRHHGNQPLVIGDPDTGVVIIHGNGDVDVHGPGGSRVPKWDAPGW